MRSWRIWRQGRVALADYGIVTIQKGLDEVITVDLSRRLHHLCVGGVRAVEFDVVLNSVRKEVTVFDKGIII